MLYFLEEIVCYNSSYDRNHTISQPCSTLKFPRSTYYKVLVCVPSNRQKEYEAFSRRVKSTYDESKQLNGAVKICRQNNGIFIYVGR